MTAKNLLDRKEGLRELLLEWYDLHKRKMPWRQTKDPYAILVSEIMLQQTQVKTVIPYFEAFLEKFPTASSLAQACESDVLKAWQGLGYYRRAKHLQQAAQQIDEEFEGNFPKEKGNIDRLKGVGSYTSAAVASIAFDLPHACVDGNVVRVLTRLAAWNMDVSLNANAKTIALLAQALLDECRPGDYNQAIMELGATVCTPRNPSCLTCPLSSFCQTHQKGHDPHTRPVKTKRTKVQEASLDMMMLVSDGHILLAKRPTNGLMADLWEIPAFGNEERHLRKNLSRLNPTLIWRRPKPFRHKFSHLHVDYHVSIWALELQLPAIDLPHYADNQWHTHQTAIRQPLTRVCSSLLQELLPYLKSEPLCQNVPSVTGELFPSSYGM